MDYKKLYKEAIKRAKSWAKGEHPECFSEAQKAVDFIFPELKESDDEKIRKSIHIYLDWLDGRNKDYQPKGDYTIRDMIDWLVKQSEQSHWKPTEEQLQTIHAQLNEGAVTYPDDKRVLTTLYEDLMKITTQEEKKNWQKPADKIEPKFNVGDWVVSNPELCFESPLCIKDIDNNNYRVESVDGCSGVPTINYLDNYYHLWTIKDAKDGDVLYSHNKNLLWIYKDKTTYHAAMILDYAQYNCISTNCDIVIPLDTYPTTKEQRELLFSKMKEAGYEWDADKKELKKIEQKDEKSKMTPFEKEVSEIIDEAIEDDKGLFNVCEKLLSLAKDEIEQKPSWSEEDEEMIEDIIDTIQSLLNTNESWSYLEDYLDWLKSLKNRVQPQQEWSENDKEQLDRAIYMMGQLGLTKSWDDVYNWLKSLEERIIK